MNTLNVNTKLAKTGIVSIDLAEILKRNEWEEFDFANFLFQGLVVREKEFKSKVAKFDWNQFKNKKLALFCSTDAIIPSWVYMFMTCELNGVVKELSFARKHDSIIKDWENQLQKLNFDAYKDKKVVIIARPGIPPAIYLQISKTLQPIVKTLMYGEVGLPKVIWKRK